MAKKTRKQYPDRDERIAMADEKIEKLEKLYAENVMLHDYFGKGGNDVMHRLFQ